MINGTLIRIAGLDGRSYRGVLVGYFCSGFNSNFWVVTLREAFDVQYPEQKYRRLMIMTNAMGQE